jgi:bifunctional UDP-N-acetylglucosamine pyrophosphorylase/glucosamine-1-phosphate N-acetyltransferase
VSEIRVLIAAAGRGTRAGLPYPKTLYPVQGVPILVRLLRLMAPFDDRPTVIVSPTGKAPIADCLAAHDLAAHLVEQPAPTGMGAAVLTFTASPVYAAATDVLLAWGDIPLLQPETIAAVVEAHRRDGNDFTMATRLVDAAYTVVTRDAQGEVTRVTETRESGQSTPQAGEREIGLFVFRKEPVFALLRENLPDRYGRSTGEHGLLYVIGHLASRGGRVKGLPVATEMDLISLNALSDLGAFR